MKSFIANLIRFRKKRLGVYESGVKSKAHQLLIKIIGIYLKEFHMICRCNSRSDTVTQV
jgi:hypothetical protein